MDAKKIPIRVAAIFYALIMLEVIIMGTPFAVYFYSFYGPMLQGLHQSPWTAWASSFFLPHSVLTSSTFLEFFRWRLGTFLFVVGMLGFFIFAVQLYSAKLRRKGVVKNFVYSYIRHPQYLCLMIAGLGLLTFWPRIVILLLYIGMIFTYFYLAKFEERRMQSKHPDYLQYLATTAMFIPGNPGAKLFQFLFGWILNRALAQIVAAVMVISVLLAGAIGLRNLTISHVAIARMPEKKLLAISVFPRSEAFLREVIERAMAPDVVQQVLTKEGNVSFTAHILPVNYGMVGMFADLDRRREEDNRPHVARFWDVKARLMGSQSDEVKVVFSRMDNPGRNFVPVDEILGVGAKMTPVVVVDLDLATKEVRDISIPLRGNAWGDIPMPIF